MPDSGKTLTQFQKDLNRRFLTCLYEVILDPNNRIKDITDFCKRTGITAQQVSYCKKNERCFSMEDILKLYRHFHYSPNYILINKPPRKLK